MEKRVIQKLLYKFEEDGDASDATAFFIELNQVVPSIAIVEGPFLYKQYIELVSKMYASDFMIDWSFSDGEYNQLLIRIKHKDGFMLIKNRRTHSVDDEMYDIKKNQQKYIDKKFGWLVFTEVDIMYNCYDGFPDDFINALAKIRLDESDSYSKIHLLCQNQDIGLYTKELPMTSADLTFDLDLHYGEGFIKYHDLNIKRITDQNKGIILLHGSPGTGKSWYVRRLIRDLAKYKKNILYMPNNMIDMLGTPTFNDFLIDWAEDNMEDGYNKKFGILLVIEDAERVLIKREINQYGADGVSNILNSSDGILNDFLNIQVLATFNSDIENIDEAILRKKRMLSIREFKKLSVKQSQLIIDHYEIGYIAEEEMSLADIFSLKDDDEDSILLGNKKKKTDDGIGFKFKQ